MSRGDVQDTCYVESGCIQTGKQLSSSMSIATLVTKEDADLVGLKGIISGTLYFISFHQSAIPYEKYQRNLSPLVIVHSTRHGRNLRGIHPLSYCVHDMYSTILGIALQSTWKIVGLTSIVVSLLPH